MIIYRVLEVFCTKMELKTKKTVLNLIRTVFFSLGLLSLYLAAGAAGLAGAA